MKKSLLALLLLAGSATAARAQTTKVHVGLKAGVTFAKFIGSDAVDNVLVSSLYRVGFSAGGLAEIDLAKHFAVQPELLYTSKGTKQIIASTVASYQNLGYLDIPVLLKFKIPHFFVEAGPQVGVLLHAKQTVESTTTQEIDNKSTFHSTDLGYAVGLGVQDTNGLLLGVRYNGGLTNVFNVSPQPSVRNNVFHIYLGYVFGSTK